jgi:hypothetical protein
VVVFRYHGFGKGDAFVFDEIFVILGYNVFVCLEDGVDFSVDEMVVRVEMLFDQTLDFQERRQELPLVLLGRGDMGWMGSLLRGE